MDIGSVEGGSVLVAGPGARSGAGLPSYCTTFLRRDMLLEKPCTATLKENLRMSVEDRIAEVRACSEMPEYQRAKQIEKLQGWSKNWAPTGRRTSLQGVRRPDGIATTEPDEAITLLSDFWPPVLAEHPINRRKARRFLLEHGVALPTIDWKLTYDHFEAMIARMVDSAPGPDGLP